MMRKKILVVVITAIVLFSGIFFLINNTRMDADQFYSQRNELTGATEHIEDIQAFKTAFRKAVTNEGYEVQDDFINVWIHLGGFQQYGMNYHVLTTDNDYLLFSVKTPHIEDASRYIINNVPLEKGGFNREQIAQELVYYVDKSNIKLDETSIN